jgi:phage shock protein A
MSETLTQGGLAVSLLTNAALLVREFMRSRKHARNNAAMIEKVNAEAGAKVAVAEQEHDAVIAPKLLDRITALERRLDARDSEIDACEDRARQLGASLAIARGDVARLAALLEELLAEGDNANARAEVAEIRARNSTPQPFAAVTSAPDRGNGTGRHRLRTPALATVSDRGDMKPHGGEE